MVRLSIVSAVAGAVCAAAGKSPAAEIVPGAFIFELEPNHDVGAFEQTVKKDGDTRLKLDYELFKGVSVQLHDTEKADEKVKALAALPAVKKVYPVRLYSMPNPEKVWAGTGGQPHDHAITSRDVGKNDTFSPHIQTQVDKLRAKGITGKGVKVAVVDTGIDYKHEALGGCFGPGCLVTFGTDLVGDAYTGSNTPRPDPDPMDCAGHGTHVAGIVAAQPNHYGFTGTAPDVKLGAYRVFGCEGQAGNDVLIAAFNQAYQDGANIITASIGGPSGWKEDPWAEAVSRIVDKGVPCTVSAGNEGATGQFYASGAADGRSVSSIASYNNYITPTLYFSVKYSLNGGDDKQFGYVPADPPFNQWDVSLPAWALNYDTTVADDGCSAFPADTPDLSKYIVLLRRGTCPFADKVNNAVAKGAKYVLIYDNGGGPIAPGLDGVAAGSALGVGMLGEKQGDDFIASLKSGDKLVLKMKSPLETTSYLESPTNTQAPGALSTFTTWGPTWELDVKPQFGAIGGNVLSTYPRAKGNYSVLSGTSMSCPMTAGIIALIHEVRGTYDPELIQNLLSANANPQLFNDGAKFYDFFAPVQQQGAGLIQAFDAAYATSLISPSNLAFNDTDHFAKSQTFQISNTGKKSVTYKISHTAAVTMYTLAKDSIYPMPFPNEPVDGAASLKFSDSSVTIAPGRSHNIKVSPTAPSGIDAKRLPVWSGWVAINGTDGSSLSIPYQGISGSMRSSTVLGAKDTWIAKSTDKDANPVAPNSTFTIPGPGNAGANDTLPELAINLALGSRLVRADIVPLTTCPPKNITVKYKGINTIGQPYGFPAEYLTRGLSPIPWDGRLDSGNYAPPGKYRFVVRALRIFGNPKKDDDWDVSTSPGFFIKYE